MLRVDSLTGAVRVVAFKGAERFCGAVGACQSRLGSLLSLPFFRMALLLTANPGQKNPHKHACSNRRYEQGSPAVCPHKVCHIYAQGPHIV